MTRSSSESMTCIAFLCCAVLYFTMAQTVLLNVLNVWGDLTRVQMCHTWSLQEGAELGGDCGCKHDTVD